MITCVSRLSFSKRYPKKGQGCGLNQPARLNKRSQRCYLMMPERNEILIHEAKPESELAKEATDIQIKPYNSPYKHHSRYWCSSFAQRSFLDHMKEQLGGQYEHLYGMTKAHIIVAGGDLLLTHYRTIFDLVAAVFPEHPWKPWKFQSLTTEWWQNLTCTATKADPCSRVALSEFAAERGEPIDQVLEWLQRQYPTAYDFTQPVDRRIYLETTFLNYDKTKSASISTSSYNALYSLTIESLLRNGGWKLVHMYESTPPMMVMTEFPEHPWRPWEFKKSIKLWWQNLAEEEARGNEIAAAAVREYLLLLAEKLGVQHVKDIPFYNYPTVTLHLNYFGSIPALLSRLGLLEAQKQTSTESDFIQNIPQSLLESARQPSFWRSFHNRRQYFDALKNALGGTYDSLYSIERHHIQMTGGYQWIEFNTNSSVVLAVMMHYPEHLFKPWLFYRRSPRGWWRELAHGFHTGSVEAESTVRRFVEDAAEQLGIKSLSDWERISLSSDTFESLRHSFNLLGGLRRVLIRLYPLHTWPEAWFNDIQEVEVFSDAAVASGYWSDPLNRHKFMDFIKTQLGGSMESLYKLSQSKISELGGSGILGVYQKRVTAMVVNLYPEHSFQIWKFHNLPSNYWTQLGHAFRSGSLLAAVVVRDYMDHLALELKIESPINWVHVTSTQLPKRIASALKALGGLPYILRVLFPEIDWKAAWNRGNRLQQAALRNHLDFLLEK